MQQGTRTIYDRTIESTLRAKIICTTPKKASLKSLLFFGILIYSTYAGMVFMIALNFNQ